MGYNYSKCQRVAVFLTVLIILKRIQMFNFMLFQMIKNEDNAGYGHQNRSITMFVQDILFLVSNDNDNNINI